MHTPEPEHDDLFISYAEVDRAWVQNTLIPALGLSLDRVLTHDQLTPGKSRIEEFERAVLFSRYTLLILTPEYLKDPWSRYGELLGSHVSVAEQRDRVIPLYLRPCKLPVHIEFRVPLDCTDETRQRHEIGRLRELLGVLEDTIEPSAQQPLPVPTTAEEMLLAVRVRRWIRDLPAGLEIELAEVFEEVNDVRRIVRAAQRLMATACPEDKPLPLSYVSLGNGINAWESAVGEAAKVGPRAIMALLLVARSYTRNELRLTEATIKKLLSMPA